MNRSYCLLPVALLLLTSFATTGNAAEPLRWKFNKGERFRYDMKQQMNNQVDAGPRGNITTTMVQDMNMFWTIKDVSPEGNATIIQTFDRIQMTMTMPGGQGFEYDSDSEDPPEGMAALVSPLFKAMADAEITVIMTPRGEVLSAKFPQEFVDALKNSPGAQFMGDFASEEGLKRLAEQGSMKFPEGAIEVGEKTTSKVEIKNPMLGTQIVESSYTYEGPTTVDGEEFESFTPEIKMSFAPDEKKEEDDGEGEQPPQQLPKLSNVKVTDQETNGEVLFNREQGRLSKMHVEQSFTMQMTVASQQIATKVNQTIDVDVKPIGKVDFDADNGDAEK